MGIHIVEVSAEKISETNTFNYKFTVEIPQTVNEGDILSKIEYDCKIGN
ncbi:MAG: hypothetical protein IJ366_02580 [Clostridia bacterium]|nr:hypothetical protein [Clostridia bacterium]